MSDYISRDELLELYAPDPAIPNFDSLKLTVAVARQNVLDMPAADVAPVRYGRWIHDINNRYGCSECMGRETMSHTNLKPYCPNCGARMDKEDEHEAD